MSPIVAAPGEFLSAVETSSGIFTSLTSPRDVIVISNSPSVIALYIGAIIAARPVGASSDFESYSKPPTGVGHLHLDRGRTSAGSPPRRLLVDALHVPGHVHFLAHGGVHLRRPVRADADMFMSWTIV